MPGTCEIQKKRQWDAAEPCCGRKEMTMSKGKFGNYGGQYVPETLMNAVNELEAAYEHYKKRPGICCGTG